MQIGPAAPIPEGWLSAFLRQYTWRTLLLTSIAICAIVAGVGVGVIFPLLPDWGEGLVGLGTVFAGLAIRDQALRRFGNNGVVLNLAAVTLLLWLAEWFVRSARRMLVAGTACAAIVVAGLYVLRLVGVTAGPAPEVVGIAALTVIASATALLFGLANPPADIA
jgi:hypothetical protein